LRACTAAIAGLLAIASPDLASARVASARFDPARAAAPFWSDGAGRQALLALGRRDHAACARSLGQLLSSEGKTARPEARFLSGYCEHKAGHAQAALAAFEVLDGKLPLLADYVHLYAAEALLALGRLEDAQARAQKVAAGSPMRAEAELTLATALERASKSSEAADVLSGYLKRWPNSWRAGEVRGRLAAALDTAGRTADATPVWREAYVENPITLGARAAPHLDKPLSADELARRATVLFDAMRNKESELAWLAVLAAPDVTPALVCRARYHAAQSVWKQRDRARSAPMFEDAIEPCKIAHDADLTAKSLYQAGRAHGSRAEKDRAAGEKAIALYARLMAEQVQHSYADDAALRRADVLDTLGRADEASAALAAVPDLFPTGDQRGEALFRLAFRAFEKQDFAAAQRWLERELAILPREEGWWEAGRTLYWLGRARAAQGADEQASTMWGRALREYPLSYYALLAANRLIDASPEAADKLLGELSWDQKRAVVAGPVEDRPLYHTEPFERALLLLRLGLGAEARRELGAAGLEAPRKGVPLPATAEGRELGWVASMLFEAAGDWSASHAYGRYVDTEYARAWPEGEGELKWRLSFPRAYAALVEDAVKHTGQPAALELAIMREESAFDPNLESFANAVGLTQLTAAPAQRFADGLPHDAQALRDPAINIPIGARELGALWTLFNGSAPLAIAGYNAGEGAVKRWLNDPDNQGRSLDEFIERIPYDETRGYTKRVLGTFFTYRWLDRSTPQPSARVPRLKFGALHTPPRGRR
jgi:soluble lytic murein transglycosylase